MAAAEEKVNVISQLFLTLDSCKIYVLLLLFCCCVSFLLFCFLLLFFGCCFFVVREIHFSSNLSVSRSLLRLRSFSRSFSTKKAL